MLADLAKHLSRALRARAARGLKVLAVALVVGGTEMNAIDALNAARSVGVELALDGDYLVLDAASTPVFSVKVGSSKADSTFLSAAQ